MAVQRIDVRVRAAAAPATVYALVRDGASWPSWAPFTGFELESPGEQGGESVGAVRVFRRGKKITRERVVELVPQRRLGYVLLSGLPLLDYRADVDLEPDEGGTRIRWHASFRPRVPGTGWLFRRVLAGYLRRCALGLAEHAGRG